MAGMSWGIFFQMMIAEEKAAQEKYKLAMDTTDSPELKKVFERLKNEEAFHAEVLEGEYQKMAHKLERSA
jgi:rubrerythrin